MQDELLAIGERADLDITEDHIIVNGQDLTENVLAADVHIEAAGTVVILTMKPGQSVATRGPGIVKIVAQTAQTPAEFMSKISPGELEQEALNQMEMGERRSLVEIAIDILKERAGAA